VIETRQFPYHEVEGDDPAKVYLACRCGQRIKKRRDSFTPNLHVVICLACNNCSAAVNTAPVKPETPAKAA
jgi:hypothetical protein